MNSNPYLSDDDDADLFDKTGDGHHVLDGSVCPRCGVVHTVSNLDDIPREILNEIASAMDTMPDEVARQAKVVVGTITSGGHDAQRGDPNPDAFRALLLRSFVDFTSDLGRTNSHGPMLRAVAEVVDEMSEGGVSRRWSVYTVENTLILHHLALKSLSVMVEALHSSDGGPPGIVQVIASIVLKVRDDIAALADRYRTMGRECGIAIDEQIISCGVYSTHLSPIAIAAMPGSINLDIEDAWKDYAQRKKRSS